MSGEEPEQGHRRKRDEVRDTKRLRALAHPLRWKLIDLIGAEGTVTATRCATVLDESVASCSYHLNVLAKYGYVEEAPGGKGREKPWRLTNWRQHIPSEGLDLKGQLVAEAASEALLGYDFDRMRAAIRRRSRDPEEWRPGTGINVATAYLTAEEAAEIKAAIVAAIDRFEPRIADPALRPEDAREVRVLASMFLAPERPKAD